MGGKPKEPKRTQAYRHGEKRKNNPEAGLIEFVPKAKKTSKEYCWDPRESPQLIWAGKAGMKRVEVEEAVSIVVPIFDLHIHERVSTEAILRAAQRQDAQRTLFADPELEFTKEIQFYQHDVDWSNRMILGDSLLVMNSLLEREGMRGKVQCIYMDPPYGIKYASNFQPRIDQRDVKDGKDEDLTREVMQVQAFRDTWKLGVHSYLTYLRDRLLLCRELLKDEGSIFVQIGDENVHRVRCLMDEVFGEENLVAQVLFRKTGGLKTNELASVGDFLLWYSKDRAALKFRRVFLLKTPGMPGATQLKFRLNEDRTLTEVSPVEAPTVPPDELVSHDTLESQGNARYEQEYRGRKYSGKYKPSPENLERLITSGRVLALGNTLRYIRKFADYQFFEVNELWDDTGISGFSEGKTYSVYTSPDVIERCILMTTDPGDLVLDPTCGSGTTAYVAEQWGRRWITMDTSRVALAIARHRLMTAAFDYYKLRHPTSGVAGGFVYKTVPHITLKSIAQNREIDTIAAAHVANMIEALRKTGVTVRGRKMMLENLRPLNHEVIHAEGELQINGLSDAGDPDIQSLRGKVVRCAVVFGPKNGALSEVHVRDAVRAAAPYDAILFCAYEFTAPAQEVINSDPVPGKRLMMAYINADTAMSDLLKDTKASQLFTLIGEPDVVVYRHGEPDLDDLAADAGERAAEVRRRLKQLKPGEMFIELRGVDLYDPLTGETQHDSGANVHAIFIDHAYDGKSFCICQALFPNKRDSWNKIARNLKGTINKEAFEAMRTQVSLPFQPGERVQVKVIDAWGNAVVKTIHLEEAIA